MRQSGQLNGTQLPIKFELLVLETEEAIVFQARPGRVWYLFPFNKLNHLKTTFLCLLGLSLFSKIRWMAWSIILQQNVWQKSGRAPQFWHIFSSTLNTVCQSAKAGNHDKL